MRNVYLVERQSRPNWHRAPYHRVILCDLIAVARAEAGWSGDRASIWEHEWGTTGGGWLVRRWRGLDIDYGYLVRATELPDGSITGFRHRDAHPWPILAQAVWWSPRPVPDRWAKRGISIPDDDFSRSRILGHYPNEEWLAGQSPGKEGET